MESGAVRPDIVATGRERSMGGRRRYNRGGRRRYLFHNQFEAVDADGAAELRAFADGDAGQMGVDGGADVVRRLLVLLDAFHEMRDHRGEGMVVDVAGFLHARVQCEEILLSVETLQIEAVVDDGAFFA